MNKLAADRFGSSGEEAVGDWRRLLTEASNVPEEYKLRVVNEFFNRKIIFGEDAAIWAQPDHWASLLEVLGQGQGDCEDFAIAKYVTLKLMGVSGEKLRLTYVRARIGGMFSQVTQAHMVLSYYPDPTDEPLILDNLVSDILPASQRPDLRPVFSFSSTNLWVGGGSAPVGDSSARLSRWRDVLTRMREEGLGSIF